LQRQVRRAFFAEGKQELASSELQEWCWAKALLIERRPVTELMRRSMNRAIKSIGRQRVRRQGRQWLWRWPQEAEND
jgi:hypothetical protein